jgi:hypothetical protein
MVITNLLVFGKVNVAFREMEIAFGEMGNSG